MADNTAIEWTDATWNPVTGCAIVSPGCTNCYAMKLAGTRLKHTPSRAGLTVESKAGPVWNGRVRFNEEWLDQPLRWKRPRSIFVCAHGDLFAPNVPDGWIMAVFDVMWRTPWHTYQVLTKRSDRMKAFVRKWCDLAGEDLAGFKNARGPDAVRKAHPSGRGQLFAAYLDALVERSGGKVPDGAAWPTFDWMEGMMRWPDIPPNVWLGVSAEDQSRADQRIPDLLATPAAIRFVSAEPLIGPIDFRNWLERGDAGLHAVDPLASALLGMAEAEGHAWIRPALDWIIVGGESGPGARPMHPAWARAIRDQCQAAGVPFFFKQWGHWADITQSDAADSAGWHARGTWMILDKHGDMDIPDHRWPDEEAGEVAIINVGKKKAGRLLDGVEHDGFPEIREVPFG